MLGEVGAVGEGLAALAALVRLGFPHVHLRVQLQVGFGSKHLQAGSRVSFLCLKFWSNITLQSFQIGGASHDL